MRYLRPLLLILLPAAAWAANTQIASDKPIVNFSLPAFSPEGYRTWLVRGSEGRYLPRQNQIEVRELTLSIFSGQADDKIETIIISPTALVTPAEAVISGLDTIRVINDQLEASGSDWRYAHQEQKVTIRHNVRVVLHTQLKSILQ